MFTCLGNYCRSPLAEAVFIDYIDKTGLKGHFAKVESSGTSSYHQGDPPDSRWVPKSISKIEIGLKQNKKATEDRTEKKAYQAQLKVSKGSTSFELSLWFLHFGYQWESSGYQRQNVFESIGKAGRTDSRGRADFGNDRIRSWKLPKLSFKGFCSFDFGLIYLMTSLN